MLTGAGGAGAGSTSVDPRGSCAGEQRRPAPRGSEARAEPGRTHTGDGLVIGARDQGACKTLGITAPRSGHWPYEEAAAYVTFPGTLRGTVALIVQVRTLRLGMAQTHKASERQSCRVTLSSSWRDDPPECALSTGHAGSWERSPALTEAAVPGGDSPQQITKRRVSWCPVLTK